MFKKSFFLLVWVMPLVALQGQTREELANLFQDVELMRQQFARVHNELLTVQRDNQILAQRLRDAETNAANALQQSKTLEAKLDATRAELAKANEQLKREIVANVSKEMDQFSKETKRYFDQVGSAKSAPASGGSQQDFNDDFPKNGVEYTVKKGDTLSKIATANNSKSAWIINANKLSSPTALRVGQVIFVPQK